MENPKEKIKYESLRKYNKFKHLKNNTTVLWTTNTNKKIFIDTEDFDKIKSYCWREDDYGYAKAGISKSEEKIKMHHIIIGKKEDLVVDHIDRNPLNNKKNNLRHVTQQLNIVNKSIQKNNNTGIIGVAFDKRGFYDVRLVKHRKVVFRHKTNDFQEAIIKRLEAEVKYFGINFAPQRHLLKEYGIK